MEPSRVFGEEFDAGGRGFAEVDDGLFGVQQKFGFLLELDVGLTGEAFEEDDVGGHSAQAVIPVAIAYPVNQPR